MTWEIEAGLISGTNESVGSPQFLGGDGIFFLISLVAWLERCVCPCLLRFGVSIFGVCLVRAIVRILCLGNWFPDWALSELWLMEWSCALVFLKGINDQFLGILNMACYLFRSCGIETPFVCMLRVWSFILAGTVQICLIADWARLSSGME